MSLSGGQGFPVDPVDAEVGFGGREGFDGDGVFLAGVQVVSHIEVVGSIGAGDLLVVGDLLAVDPEIGAVVDAAEVQPERSIALS